MGGPPFEVDTPGWLLDMDTPREEVLGIEVGPVEEAAPDDGWRIDVAVPEEDPGTPPLVSEDTEIKVEALEPPGLL